MLAFLCLCMSSCGMLKHTSSSRARAEELYHSWVTLRTVKQTGFWGQTCSGMIHICFLNSLWVLPQPTGQGADNSIPNGCTHFMAQWWRLTNQTHLHLVTEPDVLLQPAVGININKYTFLQPLTDSTNIQIIAFGHQASPLDCLPHPVVSAARGHQPQPDSNNDDNKSKNALKISKKRPR